MTYGEVGRDLIATTECHRDRYGMGRKSWWRRLKARGTFSGNLARKVEWFLLMIGVK